MRRPLSTRGFTIVELLIVIVIIGILAAITIVAYNGIQDRARVSSVNSGLSQVAKKLKLYQVDNPDTYPAAAGTNGLDNLAVLGITNTSDVTYQYSSSANTYCLTATNGTTSYKISSTSTTATAGGCAGHGVGGVAAITNLAVNPSFENDTSAWASYVFVGAPSRVTTSPYVGSGRLAATCNNTGTTPRVTTILSGLTPGSTYFVSARVRLDGQVPTYGLLQIKARSGGTEVSIPVSYQPTWAPDGNGWMYLSSAVTVPAGTDGLSINPGVVTAANCSTGTLGVDAVMIVTGSSSANYADGSSPNWAWNGTVNNSTSTGTAL